jgi:hypothetical protein
MRLLMASLMIVCLTACSGPSATPETQMVPVIETQQDEPATHGAPISTPEANPTPTLQPELRWSTTISNDPSLLGRTYASLTADGLAIYSNLEDATTRSETHFHAPSVPAYVAYNEIMSEAGLEYVHLTDGGWMLKNDTLPVQVTTFSGIELMDFVPQRFGWVLEDSNGINLETGESTASRYIRYQVIEFDDVSRKDEKAFVHAASGADWLPKSIISLAEISNKAPQGNTNCRWVDVNLTEQNLVVYENCQAVFATLVSSAKSPSITPEGTFTIFYREILLPLFSNDNVVAEPFYLQDVPWLLFFYENWAIHGTYWHDHFGEAWSHGCINVSPYDARWLYQWAQDGDMIWIHR